MQNKTEPTAPFRIITTIPASRRMQVEKSSSDLVSVRTPVLSHSSDCSSVKVLALLNRQMQAA